MNNDSLLSEATLIRVAILFKALGDETRIRILRALMGGEMCVSELADYIMMTKSAVSHQLRELRMAHLVKVRREGKRVYYSIKTSHIKEFLENVSGIYLAKESC